jgi:hypothetical protein
MKLFGTEQEIKDKTFGKVWWSRSRNDLHAKFMSHRIDHDLCYTGGHNIKEYMFQKRFCQGLFL